MVLPKKIAMAGDGFHQERRRPSWALAAFLVNILVFSMAVMSLPSSADGASVERKIDSASASSTLSNSVIPNQQGTLFGYDAAGNGITLGNWLDYASYLLAVTMGGQGMLILLALVAVHYTLFVAPDPDTHRRSSGRSEKNTTVQAVQQWNVQRIVKMITLAIETYQQLDMSEIDCQKKLLCELQQGKDVAAATARALSNMFLYFDFFKTVPRVEEYREAIVNGQRRISSRSNADVCSSHYSKCKFSILEFNEKYRRLLSS